jgi:hypothetical protein
VVRAACVGLLGLVGCQDGNSDGIMENTQNLTVQCAPQNAPLPSDAWICPAPRVVACGAAVPPLYVPQSASATCAPTDVLSASVLPLTAGVHPVTVSRPDGTVACNTTLTITDTGKPTLTPKQISLWPPNHKMHTISVDQCVSVTDSCDPDLRAEFVWASSDEPIDDVGDGHHSPDILFDDCGRVSVRAERQGPKDGRVYRLGVRVVDGAGNVSESECAVVVTHSKNGNVAADSGTKYRVALDGTNDRPTCDGVPATETPDVPAVVEQKADTVI